MSQDEKTSCQRELYFFHDPDQGSGATTTRVFFTEDLDPLLFECFIKPSIQHAVSKPESLGSIQGFPHFIALRWLHYDVDQGEMTMQELEDEFKHTLDVVITDAFGWKGSVLRHLANIEEVERIAEKLGVNWSRGQMPF